MKESSGLHKKFTLEDSAGPQTQLLNSHESGRWAVAQAKANQKNRNVSNYGSVDRGYFKTSFGNSRNTGDFAVANTRFATPEGEFYVDQDRKDFRQYDKEGNQISDRAGYGPTDGALATEEYDKLPKNIFKTSDNSRQTSQKTSVAGSEKKQPEPSKIFNQDGPMSNSDKYEKKVRPPGLWKGPMDSQDSGGMAKAPSFGFEAFLDNQLGMSGGRTLSGFDKVSGGVYKHGPAKGMTRGQYYEKARAQYAALSDDEKKNWESRAKMKDVRSTRDQAAQQQYEDKLGFNSNQDEKPKTEKAEEEKQSKGDAEPMMTSVLKNQKDRQRKTNLNKSATDKPSIEYLA